jgi:hypothetical protein
MRYIRAIMLGVALIVGGTSLASAQVLSLQLGVGDRDDRQAYSEGYRQGRWDGAHNRRADWDDNRWREGDDRRSYRDGYLRGYNEARRYNDHDADDGYYRGGYALNTARQFGYQDGYNDGLRDRQTGHSFRPTHDDNYHDANRGWDPRLVSRDDYKFAYRQAYSNGYERGYNSNGWYRR